MDITAANKDGIPWVFPQKIFMVDVRLRPWLESPGMKKKQLCSWQKKGETWLWRCA
jgi:hypothetical protein